MPKTLPTRRQSLNPKQLQILNLLYKFRFGTTNLLAQCQDNVSRQYMNTRLRILQEQEYIGRNHNESYRLRGQYASYFLLRKGIDILKQKPDLDPKVLRNIAKDEHASDRFIRDRQLSTQAFYAAESGINDATKAINDGSFTTNKDTCDPTPQFDGNVDPAHNISYTCLLINQGSVSNLIYDIDKNNAITADLTFRDTTTGDVRSAKELIIKWDTNTTDQYPNFPPTVPVAAPWSLLRMTATDLTVHPITNPNPYYRTSLNKNSFTAFLYPSDLGNAASSLVDFADNGSIAGLNTQGKIVKSDCTVGGSCTATLRFGTAVAHMVLRLGAIYASANNINISAQDVSGDQINISGAQAIVDVTGKAQDVLRRVQVRLPLNAPHSVPSVYTVQSVDGICKQLQVSSTFSLDGC